MKWQAVLLGQLLALLDTVTGVCTDLLAEKQVYVPVFQMCCLYFTLWIYIPIAWKQGFLREFHWKSIWKYLLASLFDTQANVLSVVSYQLTSLTSAIILGDSALLWVVLFSYLVLKRRYCLREWTGVSFSVLGLICIVISDLKQAGWVWDGSMLGDCVALVSAVLYAGSNICQEYLMTTGTKLTELLSLLGFFSLWITLIEALSLEIQGISSISGWESGLALTGFALSLWVFYSFTPYYLQWFGASLFNMSLLASNVYALIFSIFLFNHSIQWLYFLGFAFVAIGIILFSHQPSSKQPDSETTSIPLVNS